MIAPSTYQPQVVNLSQGAVQRVETSESDPRVAMDYSGFWATDPSGARIFMLDAIAGSGSFKGGIILPTPASNISPGPRNKVSFQRAPDAAEIAYLTAYEAGFATTNVYALLEAIAESGDSVANLQINAIGPGASASSLQLTNDGTLAGSSASIAVGTSGTKTLLTGIGDSDFLRLPQAFTSAPAGVIGPGPVGMGSGFNVTVKGGKQLWLWQASGYFTGAGGMIAWQLYNGGAAVAGQVQAEVFINEVGSHRASLFGYAVTNYTAGSNQAMQIVLATGGGSRSDNSDSWTCVCFS